MPQAVFPYFECLHIAIVLVKALSPCPVDGIWGNQIVLDQKLKYLNP